MYLWFINNILDDNLQTSQNGILIWGNANSLILQKTVSAEKSYSYY